MICNIYNTASLNKQMPYRSRNAYKINGKGAYIIRLQHTPKLNGNTHPAITQIKYYDTCCEYIPAVNLIYDEAAEVADATRSNPREARVPPDERRLRAWRLSDHRPHSCHPSNHPPNSNEFCERFEPPVRRQYCCYAVCVHNQHD